MSGAADVDEETSVDSQVGESHRQMHGQGWGAGAQSDRDAQVGRPRRCRH